MSAAPRYRFTLDQYLDYERHHTGKHEYYRGEVFAMAGGSIEHGTVASNTIQAGGTALEGKPCRVLGSDVQIYIEKADLATYPDVFFLCGEARHYKGRRDIVMNPTVIVEVLSDSTRGYDMGGKFDFYKMLDSLKEYILIDPDTAEATVHTKHADGEWSAKDYRGMDSPLQIESLGISLPMTTIFRNVELRAKTKRKPRIRIRK